MSRALSSTTKKTSDGGGSSDGCVYDKDGNPTCSVDALSIDFSETGLDEASVGGLGGGTPVSLKGDKEFEKRQNAAIKRSNNCKSFLKKLSKHATLSDIQNAINTHPAYSGIKTTDVLVRDSGIFTPDYIKETDNLPDTDENKDTKERLDLSISEYISSSHVNAYTITDPSKSGVYYNDNEYDSQTVLHESIHFATGLNDVDLANALGIKNGNREFTKKETHIASLAIKEEIYYRCPEKKFLGIL